MNNQINNQINSQLNSQFSSQLNSQLNTQLTNQLNSQINSHLNSQLSSQLNSQLTSQLNTQLNNQLTAQLTNQLTNQSNNQLNSQMNNQINTQINTQIYNQIGQKRKIFEDDFSKEELGVNGYYASNHPFIKQETQDSYGQTNLVTQPFLQNNFNIIQTPMNFGSITSNFAPTVDLDTKPDSPTHAEFAYDQQLKYSAGKNFKKNLFSEKIIKKIFF